MDSRVNGFCGLFLIFERIKLVTIIVLLFYAQVMKRRHILTFIDIIFVLGQKQVLKGDSEKPNNFLEIHF